MEKLMLIRLEDRILFDAAAAADAAAAEDLAEAAAEPSDSDASAIQNDGAAEALNAVLESSGAFPVPDDPAKTADIDAANQLLIEGKTSEAADSGDGTKTSGTELVVINSSVPEAEKIIDAAGENREVVILSDRTGLKELLAHLESSDAKYDAVHFLTHGNENELSINGEQIRYDHFDAEPWRELGTHLNSGADLLFYGCSLAATEDGQSLISSIGEAAGADAAASDDATGFHGDWDLEYTRGDVETGSIQVSGYAYDLESHAVTVTTYAELSDAIDEAGDGTYSEYTITLGSDIAWGITDAAISMTFDYDLTLTLQAAGAFDTLTGNGTDGFFDFTVDSSAEVTINLSGITFTGAGESAVSLYVSDGTGNLNVSNAVFQDNAGSYGAAINAFYYDTDAGGISISASVFVDNTASNQGGAIDIVGGVLTIEKSAFYDNSVTVPYYGGGAIMATDSAMTVINSTFSGNTADANTGLGGAIHVQDGTANILDSTFSGNDAFNGRAVYNNDGTVAIANSIAVSAAVGEAELFHETASTGSLRVIATLYGAAENCTVVETDPASVSGLTAGDLFADDTTTTPYAIEIDNSKAAAYSGVLLGKTAGGEYAYKSGDDWLKIADNTSVGGVTAITADQLSGDRGKVYSDLEIAEYAVGAVVPGTLLVKAVQTDAAPVYNGLKQSSAVVYQTAGGKEIAAAKISGVTAGETSSKNVGEYAAVAPDVTSAAVTGKTGYDFEAVSGTITITPKSVTVSGITAADKVYDGNADAAINMSAAAITGKVDGDDLSVTAAGGTFADKNVGTGKTVAIDGIALTGTDAGNYTIGSTNVVTASITVRHVTMTSASASKPYDGTPLTDHTVTESGDGFADGEGVSAYDVTGSQTEVGSSPNWFTYTLKPNTLAGNYEITLVYGTLSVYSDSVISITAGSASHVYDGNSFAYDSYTYTGTIVVGDTLIVDISGSIRNVGTAANLVTGYRVMRGDVDVTSDYQFSPSTAGTLTVTARDITVTAQDVTAVYGDGFNLTYTCDTDLGTGDRFTGVLAVSGTRSGSGNYTAGPHEILQGSLKIDDGNGGNNYNLSYVGAVLTVTPRTLTADNVLIQTQKTYDGTTDASFRVSGICSGDDLQVEASFAYNDPNVVNARTVSLVSWGGLQGADAGNYQYSGALPSSVPGTIVPRTVTAQWVDDAPYIYDGKDHTESVSSHYLNVKGEQVPLQVAWNGRRFIEVDFYRVNAYEIEHDPNYFVTETSREYIMYAPSQINEDSSSSGLNANYSSTEVVLKNDISSRLLDSGNPYVLRYPELISAELHRYTVNHQINEAFMERNQPMLEMGTAPLRFAVSGIDFRDNLMVSGNPMQTLGGSLTSGTNLVNVEGFSAGHELHLGDISVSGAEFSDDGLDEPPAWEAPPDEFEEGDNSFLQAGQGWKHSVPALDPAEIPVLKENALRKAEAFKDDLEHILEKLLFEA